MYEKYNGDAANIELASIVASKSTCKKRQVGAVIGDAYNVVSYGYNGAPKQISPCETCLREGIDSGKCLGNCRAIHAEQLALIYAMKKGINVAGMTMYCTSSPCNTCAKMIIAAGISKVLYLEKYPDELADQLFEEANIPCIQYTVEN